MVNQTIGKILTVLLMTSCLCISNAAAQDQLQFMAQVAKAVQVLGKTTVCIALHGKNSEILSKAYKAYDATVAGVKANVDGPLTEEKFAALLKIVVQDTSAAIAAVDPTCNDVSNYCSDAIPPAEAAALAALGKSLVTMGATLECLVANPNPDHLAKIPIIMGTAIQKVAAHKGDSITSVGILLPEIIEIAVGFQSLGATCSNVSQKC